MKSAGKRFIVYFFILEGIMVLRIGHRSRFEPAIEHLRDAAEFFAVMHDFKIIDKMAMEVGDFLACLLLQFFDAGDDEDLTIFAAPNRDRRAPITVAGDCPVARTLQPFSEAAPG